MEDDQYIKAYSLFRSELRKISPQGELITYDWLSLPKNIPGQWMVYFEMLDDYSRELANIINQFLIDIEKLSAWDKVLLDYEEDDRFYIVREFVRPICTNCLNLPYAIRSRFIFFVTHLSHQANSAILGSEWKDNLPPDDKIDFSTTDKFAANWPSYKKLKLSMERLSDKKYQAEVNHYRHKYHHRYPSHIGFGFSEMVTRNIDQAGKVSYAIGYSHPLQIGQITSAIRSQHAAAVRCFTDYQQLVKEQTEKILNT